MELGPIRVNFTSRVVLSFYYHHRLDEHRLLSTSSLTLEATVLQPDSAILESFVHHDLIYLVADRASSADSSKVITKAHVPKLSPRSHLIAMQEQPRT